MLRREACWVAKNYRSIAVSSAPTTICLSVVIGRYYHDKHFSPMRYRGRSHNAITSTRAATRTLSFIRCAGMKLTSLTNIMILQELD